jgi:hypothetical protein
MSKPCPHILEEEFNFEVKLVHEEDLHQPRLVRVIICILRMSSDGSLVVCQNTDSNRSE